MAETPRLLFVHAHPDDESLNNGATIAHYIAAGAHVRVVTCTLGEEGEVIGDRWAELAVDRADQLGGYRIGELTPALRALGISEPIYLGGAGRWRDSGMAGTEPRRRRRFVDADEREVVGALVAIIREQRPHVVVTYDPQRRLWPSRPRARPHRHHRRGGRRRFGGRATIRASPGRCRSSTGPCLAKSAFKAAFDALRDDDLQPEWTMPPPVDDIPFGFSDDDIDAVVETGPEARAAKVAALAAHATQVIVGPTGRVCALSNNMAMPIIGDEHYVLAAGSAGRTRRARLGNRSARGTGFR